MVEFVLEKKKQLFVNIYCSANTLEIIFNKDL